MDDMKLWYKKPAEDWNEALPIGNGRIAGMVFGTVNSEYVQLNEDSVWYGGPRDRNNKDALKNLPKLRQLLFDGRIGDAQKLALMAFSGTPQHESHYETLGNLHFNFDQDESKVENYTRELSLSSAEVKVKYTYEGVNYTREFFVSEPDQVMVIRFTADKPGKISFSGELDRINFYEKSEGITDDTVMMTGRCGGENGIRFCTAIKAVAEGGAISTIGEYLIADKADSVTVFLSAATDFRFKDKYKNVCLDYIKAVENKSFDDIFKAHIEDYEKIYGRVSLDIKGTDDSIKKLPTDERLQRVKDGFSDNDLISIYFQFGRYLLISCSRPGTLPANLQGIWNKDMLPPWGGKYTININTEMNYWHAETCNLAECHEPLFDLIERMRENGRRTARVMYNCKGFMAHHNTDIWADTAPQDKCITATYWQVGAAWLCLHLWEHYAFSMDAEFLNKVYPTLKEASEFFLDYLVEDKKGRLVTCPSISPENTYMLPNGEKGSLCIGASMDSQIIYALYTRCIKAANILGIDSEFVQKLEKVLERLPKPEIGKYGQIKEWEEDYDEVEIGHRHISHLFALHPGNQITVKNTPELAVAARRTLERRLSHGGGHTGWSRAWIINMWARLEDGEEAYQNILALLRKSTLTNLFDNHPPFQIDGNFGGTAGIAEMLLQSHAGEVKLLPAMPKDWREGKVSGLRARGGLEVSIEWKDGALAGACINPTVSGKHTITYGDKSVEIDFVKGQKVCLNNKLDF